MTRPALPNCSMLFNYQGCISVCNRPCTSRKPTSTLEYYSTCERWYSCTDKKRFSESLADLGVNTPVLLASNSVLTNHHLQAETYHTITEIRAYFKGKMGGVEVYNTKTLAYYTFATANYASSMPTDTVVSTQCSSQCRGVGVLPLPVLSYMWSNWVPYDVLWRGLGLDLYAIPTRETAAEAPISETLLNQVLPLMDPQQCPSWTFSSTSFVSAQPPPLLSGMNK